MGTYPDNISARDTYERIKYQASGKTIPPTDLPEPICNEWLRDLCVEIDMLRDRIKSLEKH